MRNDPDTPTPAASSRSGETPASPDPREGRDGRQSSPDGLPHPADTGGALDRAGSRESSAVEPPRAAPRAPESEEREAAWRRGRERRAQGAAGHPPATGRADPALAHRAFGALCENVRDYAIFLLDAEGVIRFWGEGARLIKWWTKEEAEGAHLRLLYPDAGSEDGTAEEHLADATRSGESVGEGHRVRSDGSLFWARITLTALRDEQGVLLGFAKMTVDRTAQRAADVARELAAKSAELEAARGERSALMAETAVLEEELGVLRAELAARDAAAREPRGSAG